MDKADKANHGMGYFYVSDKEREMYFAVCRYESDRVSMINESERKGRAKGFREGAHQKALETTRILKQHGDSISKIMKATGLSEEEIEKL